MLTLQALSPKPGTMDKPITPGELLCLGSSLAFSGLFYYLYRKKSRVVARIQVALSLRCPFLALSLPCCPSCIVLPAQAALTSHYHEGLQGVIQKLQLKEHRLIWNSLARKRFQQPSHGFRDLLGQYLIGEKPKGILETEEMLRVGAGLTGIGELSLQPDGSLHLQPPAQGGEFFLCLGDWQTVLSELESASGLWKGAALLCAAAGLAVLLLIFPQQQLQEQQKMRSMPLLHTCPGLPHRTTAKKDTCPSTSLPCGDSFYHNHRLTRSSPLPVPSPVCLCSPKTPGLWHKQHTKWHPYLDCGY
uniref:RING-type E3 ubiquitin transferase n=1 Tax=Serinus canaria TaxID=9135 RepID=A0A8C9NLC7_SERCA